MELSQICGSLIKKLKTNNNSIKDFRDKTNEIDCFCQTLESKKNVKQDFIKSTYVVEVVHSILDLSVLAVQKQSFQLQRFEAVPRFFKYLAANNIPLSKEEKDSQKVINIIIDIFALYIPISDNEPWLFWLELFTEMMKMSTFFNMFRGDNSDDNDNEVSYAKLDLLFKFVDDLMKFKRVSTEGYEKHRSQALIFFSTFLEESPFPPLPDTIDSFFELSDALAEQDLPDRDFTYMLSILNNLIAFSPVSFLINSNSPFHAPFNESILRNIFEKWQNYQKTPFVRKSASAYLLLFLTTMDAMEYKIDQKFIDDWAKRILEVWSSVHRRAKIFESTKDIPYLRADVEFLKRAKDVPISRCLLQYILPNNKLNLNSSIVWLFTAIGTYAPSVIHQEHWLQVLENISKYEIAEAALLNQDTLIDFYCLVSMMVDVIEANSHWNDVYAFLNRKQPSKEQTIPFYGLIMKILSNQRIDTKVCHEYQNILWNGKADPSNFTIERLRCIHNCIYYYGFANETTRAECFTNLVSLLEYKDKLSVDYMKQLSLTICSVVLSHACTLIELEKPKIHEETIDDVCNKLTKALAITTAKKKIDAPLQNEEFFMVTPESSQVTADDDSQLIDINLEIPNENNEKGNENKKPIFALCNFINRDTQNKMIRVLQEKLIPIESNARLFKLFLTSAMPDFFSPTPFFSTLEDDFTQNCHPENFPSYIKVFIKITEEIPSEDFQPFFEEIDTFFFEVTSQYIRQCENKIRSYVKDSTSMSWSLLNNAIYEDYYEDLPLLAEFAVRCSQLVAGTADRFFECFQDFLSTSNWIPILHLRICTHLLKLSLSEQQISEIVVSLECITTRILQTLLVPVKEREQFISDLFSVLELNNSEPMEDLFKSISKYAITPSMKHLLLDLMQNNYHIANQVFECFWQTNSPFFILDDYSSIRLQSIDTLVSILKLKELIMYEEGVPNRCKFDKETFFNDFIVPYLKDILDEEDWTSCKQAVFTALKTLIHIVADIPELSIKSLFLIFNAFTFHSPSLFPRQCINVLFSGLSLRVHFSVFLRQFIPMMIPQFVKLESNFATFPFELFFYDEEIPISSVQAKKKFCMHASPYAIAYATANSNQQLLDFFSNAIGISTKEILQENSTYICSYLLEVCAESMTDEEKSGFKEMFNKLRPLMPGQMFESPLPLLNFISMASENSIFDAYEGILRKTYYSYEFIDIRNFLFSLYTTIFKAHHELVQSFYLQQFSLYATIIFKFHTNDFEEKPTLYSDILALTVNLIEFVPTSESSRLLGIISQNIPVSFDMKMVGFIKNIEEICIHLPKHPSLSEFFDRFPKLINKIMIIDFMKETQLEKRTPLMEFKRIAKTKRLNQESISFLLKEFIEDDEAINQIDKLPNDMKRIVLGEVYKFAVLNPQTLALHLYSEMYLRFIHIHPSPLIIGSNPNASISLFKMLLELARDKNPSLSRSALTALHSLISRSMLPQAVTNDEFLMQQLTQYKEFARPRKNVKQPDQNSPWICRFVCGTINVMKDNQLCSAFGSICAVSPEFCRLLFPHLFSECLNDEMYAQMVMMFKQFSKDPQKHLEECRLFITAFNYLRGIWFLQEHINDSTWHLKWGGVIMDFQLIMKVCLEIGDPYSAYQYAEFAHEAYKISDEHLRKIFTHLGVNDLKYGLNTDFSDRLAVAELHVQEGRMNRGLVLYDSAGDYDLMCESLRSLHLYHFLNQMKSKNIESLWRLRQWTVSSEMAREMKANSHSSGIFTVMQAFATHNEAAVAQKLSDFAQQFHFDANSSIFTQLSFLLDAAALQWFQAVLFPNNSTKLYNLFPQDIISLYRRSLEKLNNLSKRLYKITESANALHGVFFCITDNLKSPISPNIPPQFFSNVIQHARENNEIESAQYFISLLRENQRKVPQFANFEQIQNLYLDSPYHAISLLEKNYESLVLTEQHLSSEKRRNVFNLRVELAKASWSAHTNYKTSDLIYGQLEEVIQQAININSIELLAEAEFTIARFYHRHHREICDYFTSAEYNSIIEIIANGLALIEQRGNTRSSSTSRTTKQDVECYQNIIVQKKNLFSIAIVKAIGHYMNTLIHTSKYDLESTFSIIGLWFDYSYTKYKPFVQEVPDLIPTMEVLFPNIDPLKFLPLFYQLAARVDDMGEISSTQSTNYNQSFQEFLREMVTSICQKAPNECFPVLFALIKNDLVKSTSDGMPNVNHKKIEAISDLVNNITSISLELSDHWNQLQKLLTSYLLLAKSPQMQTQETSLSKLSSGMFADCISSKRPKLTIITHANDIGISRFQDRITVLTGVNHPMLLKIEGTDGRTYKQIVKGNKDDLRQDAVMQQLFVLSSKLLNRQNPDLSVRHYKVIPLSPTAGVIEFVEGSMSIQDYLFRKPVERPIAEGAHTRYYIRKQPNQQLYPYEKYLKRFHEISGCYHAKKGVKYEHLIKCFRTIRSKLNPVFHFFFIEKFPNPGDWFVSRLRYCRHTATNSIVGHILGIGDRHLNNILIDEKTGEVIHIDLGIAFDQGKALPIMERVPFRLTNEIIDGMGWMGKEGIFRRACEESMQVLRSNSEYLLTVLKVFMSDPLYNWSLMPKKQQQRDKATSFNDVRASGVTKNQFAESVIVTCNRKLEGRETGENLSVEGQVSKLINDATNEDNLAFMFAGWKPYL